MKWMPFLLSLLISHLLFAQQNKGERIIYKDTINIRGFVFYNNGKPAFNTQLISQQKDLKYDYLILSTSTDSTGYFELKGAKYNDTLTARSYNSMAKCVNRGARYLVITLPAPRVDNLNTFHSLTVTAPRLHPRPIPKFKVQQYQDPGIFEDSEFSTEYPGGIDKFYKFIESKLTYPSNAVKANIEGVVEVKFTIQKDGKPGNFKIIKGIGYGCDDMVLGILKQSPKWRQGLYYGYPEETDYSVSVEFKLTDK